MAAAEVKIMEALKWKGQGLITAVTATTTAEQGG